MNDMDWQSVMTVWSQLWPRAAKVLTPEEWNVMRASWASFPAASVISALRGHAMFDVKNFPPKPGQIREKLKVKSAGVARPRSDNLQAQLDREMFANAMPDRAEEFRRMSDGDVALERARWEYEQARQTYGEDSPSVASLKHRLDSMLELANQTQETAL